MGVFLRLLPLSGLLLSILAQSATAQQSPPRPRNPPKVLEPPEFGQPALPADPPNYDPFRDEGGVPGIPEEELNPEHLAGPHVGWAATIASAPLGVFVSAGRVFVNTSGGMVHALSVSTGRELWRSRVGAPVTARATIAAGQLVVGTSLGTLISFDPQTGERKNVLTGGGEYTLPLVASEERLVVLTSSSRLQLHEASSLRMLHQRQISGEVRVAPVIAGDLVLLATRQGSVVAHQLEDGVEAWSARLAGQIVTPITMLHGFPTVAVVGTSLGSVVGFDVATGRELWQHQASGAYVGGALSQGRLLLAFRGNNLTELNPVNGHPVRPAMIGGDPVAPPLFTPSGVAVFLNGGYVDLYSLDLTRLDRLQLPGRIVGLPVAAGSRFYAALSEGAVYSLKF